LRGRGTPDNPANRYEPLHLEPDPPEPGEEAPREPTRFYRDASRSILAENDSPDVPFRFSVNPYRGCEHGCAYCYARPSHEYLGFSAGLDFETRILVKDRAPELLRRALSRRAWVPEVIALSGNTDPYQPVERRLGLTRSCLEVLRDFRNPAGIITKNVLVRRDIDVLAELASWDAARVHISITTLDRALAARLEPRAAAPEQRLAAVEALAVAGIPVNVLVAPLIPGLTDHEVPAILERAAAAGARAASYILLRLAPPVDALFDAWLARHLPERRKKILGRIRDTRGGRISDARFGSRMRGEGAYAAHLAGLFQGARRRHGLEERLPPASAAAFRPESPPDGQAALF
jgi:DNA repair photolyase